MMQLSAVRIVVSRSANVMSKLPKLVLSTTLVS